MVEDGSMTKKSRGMLEADFSRAMVQFEKEHLGRGPADVQTYFIQDMVLVRLRGILTPAEQKLAEKIDGRELVKTMRRQLFENSRHLLEAIVHDVLDCKMLSLHTDMSTRTGERIVVFVVDQDLDQRFSVRR
jgi:uncharacterized protein YbcI